MEFVFIQEHLNVCSILTRSMKDIIRLSFFVVENLEYVDLPYTVYSNMTFRQCDVGGSMPPPPSFVQPQDTWKIRSFDVSQVLHVTPFFFYQKYGFYSTMSHFIFKALFLLYVTVKKRLKTKRRSLLLF